MEFRFAQFANAFGFFRKVAKTINVSVLAEGVETEKQLQFLKENGCLLIQGHYFSPAIDADDLLKLLEKTRAQGTIIHSLQ